MSQNNATNNQNENETIEIPFAYVEREGGYIWKVIDCPYCHKEHFHSRKTYKDMHGNIFENLGFRIPHCDMPHKPYYLTHNRNEFGTNFSEITPI
jgi:hypothetical protein